MLSGKSPLRHTFLAHGLRDEGGGIAILFALMLTLLLGMFGIAVDYSRAVSAQTLLGRAADAAALAAARDIDATTGDVIRTAKAYIDANTSGANFSAPLTANIQRSTGSDSAVKVELSTRIDTTMTTLLGFRSLDVTASASAAMPGTHDTIYAVVDMSASMGLAADESARKALEAVTAPYHPGGCMFGCHMRDGFEPDGKTVHQMARENNIPLREDVLNTAMATFAADFLNAAGPAGGDRRRIGVIGFSQVALLLQAPTNNAADVLGSFAAFPNTSRLNTYFEKLYDAVAMVGPQGNGTQASPRKTVLLITDGMAFMREDPYAWWRGPIRQSICDMVKSLDLKLAVLEIKYQAAPGNPSFDAHVADVFPKVSPALEACATPGLYFVAEDSDTASLHEAFAKLGSALQSQLALTQ